MNHIAISKVTGLLALLSTLALSASATAEVQRKGADSGTARGDGTLVLQGRKTAGGSIAATGPKEGKPCGSAGREQPRSESGIAFQCTMEGKPATCSCTATCTATCKQAGVMGQGNVYQDRCDTPTSCNVTLTGGNGVTFPEVQPSW